MNAIKEHLRHWKRICLDGSKTEMEQFSELHDVAQNALMDGVADEVFDLILTNDDPVVRDTYNDFLDFVTIGSNIIYLTERNTKNTQKKNQIFLAGVASQFGVIGDVSGFSKWMNEENNKNKISELISKFSGWAITGKDYENIKTNVLNIPLDINKYLNVTIEDRHSMSYLLIDETINNHKDGVPQENIDAVEQWKTKLSSSTTENAIFSCISVYRFESKKIDLKLFNEYIVNGRDGLNNLDILENLKSFWQSELKKILPENLFKNTIISPPMGFSNAMEYVLEKRIQEARGHNHNLSINDYLSTTQAPFVSSYSVETTSETIKIKATTFEGDEEIEIPRKTHFFVHFNEEQFKKVVHEAMTHDTKNIQKEYHRETAHSPKKPTLH